MKRNLVQVLGALMFVCALPFIHFSRASCPDFCCNLNFEWTYICDDAGSGQNVSFLYERAHSACCATKGYGGGCCAQSHGSDTAIWWTVAGSTTADCSWACGDSSPCPIDYAVAPASSSEPTGDRFTYQYTFEQCCGGSGEACF
jgi:hypothetical protein